MQRKSTDYLTGWQANIAYMDEDMEQFKRMQEAIVLKQRQARVRKPFPWTWLLGIVCLGIAGYLFVILWMGL